MQNMWNIIKRHHLYSIKINFKIFLNYYNYKKKYNFSKINTHTFENKQRDFEANFTQKKIIDPFLDTLLS